MKIFLLAVFFQLAIAGHAQKLRNQFFVFHNIIIGDNTYNSFDSQVKLVKANGFDGVEIGSEESFDEMFEAIKKNDFKCSSFYVKLRVEDKNVDSFLTAAIKKLKGSGTVISPHIERQTQNREGPTAAEDEAVIKLLQKLSDLCAESNLQVAIYPHKNFYLETTTHALSLVKKVNRKNVGLGFNLCHWLATTGEQERRNLYAHLETLRPYLKMMTINGANDVISQESNLWNDYILPLGQGSFNTKGLVEFATGTMNYQGPIGIQAFNIKGDKKELLLSTAEFVRQLKKGR
jgi:sugar phosphate isomerase/epimerase